MRWLLTASITILCCATSSSQTVKQAAASQEQSGLPYLQQDESCAEGAYLDNRRATRICAPGLVCCAPPQGAQSTESRATCILPNCKTGDQFCANGCWSPPVP